MKVKKTKVAKSITSKKGITKCVKEVIIYINGRGAVIRDASELQ